CCLRGPRRRRSGKRHAHPYRAFARSPPAGVRRMNAVERILPAASIDMTGPLMQLSGLSKAYGPVTVLSDVDLDIRSGEIHAIIGENGAGKSTLMRLISGHVKPTAGTISLAGEPIAFS